MDFWQKIKNDIQKGIREGFGIVREGMTVAKAKAEELTEEGKRRLKIFELKTKVQREISELGGRVYAVSGKLKNPMLDKKAKAVIARIKKLETQIAKLEVKKKAAFRKATRKRVIKPKSK
jgi:hypothetical protein